MGFKEIRDPVHGWVRLSEDEAKYIDECPYIQRLRHISQDGMVPYVYPSAKGTRFEHSLGTMYLAERMVRRLIGDLDQARLRTLLEALNLYDEGIEALVTYVKMSGLHHDIGHPPLSHVLDGYMSINLDGADEAYSLGIGKEHEVAGLLNLSTGMLRRHVARLGLDPDTLALFTFYKLIKRIWRITSYTKHRGVPGSLGTILELYRDVEGQGEEYVLLLETLSSIVSGPFDADRLDYTLRDIYMTGAGSGSNAIDVDRLITYLHPGKGYLIFDDKAKAFLEGYMIARYNLYKWVYTHHKVLLYSEFVRESIGQILSHNRGLRDSALRFINGNPAESDLDRYVDYAVMYSISDYYYSHVDEKGPVLEYLDSIMHRRTEWRALWKRDEDYISLMGVGNALLVNRLIDELKGEGSVKNILKIKEAISDKLTDLKGCGGLIVSVPLFEVEFKVIIKGGDYTATIDEASPLVKAISLSWEQAPHIFIYTNARRLRESCGLNMADVSRAVASRLVSMAQSYFNKH